MLRELLENDTLSNSDIFYLLLITQAEARVLNETHYLFSAGAHNYLRQDSNIIASSLMLC